MFIIVTFVMVQVHSFTGSADDVLSFVSLGFYIGINGWSVMCLMVFFLIC